MEDVATIKAAFQEKTQLMQTATLPYSPGCLTPFFPPYFLSSFWLLLSQCAMSDLPVCFTTLTGTHESVAEPVLQVCVCVLWWKRVSGRIVPGDSLSS